MGSTEEEKGNKKDECCVLYFLKTPNIYVKWKKRGVLCSVFFKNAKCLCKMGGAGVFYCTCRRLKYFPYQNI
jgi:hypothetical protein